MRRYLPFLLAVFLGFFGLGLVGVHIARGDGSATGSGSALIVGTDPGSGSGSTVTPAVAPVAATLHDPTTDPLGAIGDVKAAKKSWPLLVLVVLIGLTKLLSFAGGKLAPLGRFLTRGKNAMIVAGVGTLAAVAYDSLASGASWYTAGIALVPALLALTSSHAPAGAVEKHEATT